LPPRAGPQQRGNAGQRASLKLVGHDGTKLTCTGALTSFVGSTSCFRDCFPPGSDRGVGREGDPWNPTS
uniref:Uncharacterized protein n=1 Tax=Astyanax mexicanus TaxID=7994 RepID=A0A8B9H343_ASTMX